MRLRRVLAAVFACILLGGAGGCVDDATMASYNLSKASDQFEVLRRVVFMNGITDEYPLEITGRCSIKADRADRQLEVTCKTGAREYKKHYLGLSDNMSYFVEQLEPRSVSTHHYRVVFKPQAIVPDVDLRLDAQDLRDAVTGAPESS